MFLMLWLLVDSMQVCWGMEHNLTLPLPPWFLLWFMQRLALCPVSHMPQQELYTTLLGCMCSTHSSAAPSARTDDCRWPKSHRSSPSLF